MDGKHVVIQAPNNCGSLYYNYKNSHSIVLMAVVDAQYKFLYINVGCNGRISDGGVFQRCSLYEAMQNNVLQLPQAEPLRERNTSIPYFLVADDAFAMKPYIMKPYPFRDLPAPQRIYNYRLSRARRVVENAFGILANRFRILRRPINLHPEKVTSIVLAICTLHNFLLSTNEARSHYVNQGSVDHEDPTTHIVTPGEWRQETGAQNAFLPLQCTSEHNYSNAAKDIRKELTEYFMTTTGEVQWQYVHIATNPRE